MMNISFDLLPPHRREEIEARASADIEWFSRLDSELALAAIMRLAHWLIMRDDRTRCLALDYLAAGGKVTSAVCRARGISPTHKKRLEREIIQSGLADFLAELRADFSQGTVKATAKTPKDAPSR